VFKHTEVSENKWILVVRLQFLFRLLIIGQSIYPLFGAAASDITLYGMSYIFGLTHTTYLADLVKIIPGMIVQKPLIMIGLVMLLCGFFYKLAPKGENISFDDLKGLYKCSPLLAFTLAVGAFGMAGIPPTIGFTGKLFLFTAAIEKDMYALVILAVINTGIAVFYYLKMVRAAYTSIESQMPRISLRFSTYLLGIFFIVIILYFGTFPQGFIDFAQEAVAAVI